MLNSKWARILLGVVAAAVVALPGAVRAASPYAQWTNGPPSDPTYFPIGVWLQSTSSSRIVAYQAAGFNLYIGLWQGPTESQLSALKTRGMKVICAQNTVGLTSPNRNVIVGWMHQDEPDNAQDDGQGGYGPPVLPSVIVAGYNAMKAADPTRPVLLNLGQGVAWDGYWGRGTRTNHPEDYPLYLQGCDIGSFDIYPYATTDTDPRYAPVNDKPYVIAGGVDRLVAWTNPETQVRWSFVECTNIHGYDEATPAQVKAEVWMSLVHGSNGILYFVHEFAPFIEAGLLADPVMTAAVTAINNEIRTLAPALNSATVSGAATVTSSNPSVPVDLMVKHYGGQAYLFAVGMRDGTTTATFRLGGLPASATVEVINESRTITATNGTFQDTFSPYAVHLYRATLGPGPTIVSWQTVASLGMAGVVSNEVVDGAVEPRLAGLRTLRITFDKPLDPATITAGAVTIVGQTSGPVTVATGDLGLSAGNMVLTIALPSALADADTYTVTVTGPVKGDGGVAAIGDLALTIKTLVGDVDGSGAVTAADILAARAAAGPVNAANARFDLNGSGAVTGDDLLAIRAIVRQQH